MFFNTVEVIIMKNLIDEIGVRKAFEEIIAPNGFANVRVLGGVMSGANLNYPAVYNGYFDDADALIAGLKCLQLFKGVYCTINPINDDLKSRSYNRLQQKVSGAADSDVKKIRLLPIDIDPVRPSGTSATDDQKKHALEVALKVYNAMNRKSWVTPICADSGNGFHMYYPVDVDVNDESNIINEVLKILADQFDTPEAKVDTCVGNPARIMRLYGTRACKGDEIPDMGIQHRMSHIFEVQS